MSNQELLEKLKEDMEMRGFSHYTKDSYYRKTKDIIKYFNKPMEKTGNKQKIPESIGKFKPNFSGIFVLGPLVPVLFVP